MTAPKPQTLYDRLTDEVAAFVAAITHTNAYNAGRLAVLLADCEGLAKNSAIQASLLKAKLYSATGQFELAEKWLRNVELNRAHDEAKIARLEHAIKHGHATEALGLADHVLANPAGRNLMTLTQAVVSAGGINAAITAIDTSIEKKTVLKHTANVSFFRAAAAMLGNLQVTDQDLANMIDVAGEILRRNKLYWQDEVPQIRSLTPTSGDPAFVFDYRIGVTPREAAGLTWELTSELVKRDLERQGVSIGFLGTIAPAAAIAA